MGAGLDTLFIHPSSSSRLTKLFEEAAAEVGIPAVSEQGNDLPYKKTVPSGVQWIYLTWSDPGIAPDEDSIERIEPDKLRMLGEALALALTRVVRQASY